MTQREIASVLKGFAAAQARSMERFEKSPGCGMPENDYQALLANGRRQLEALTWAAEQAAKMAECAMEDTKHWRIVHAPTGKEMCLVYGDGGEFGVMWRNAPGADFTRRQAEALSAAYIAAINDYSVRVEEVGG